jgi:acyl-homoserine lactone acylase PvdQ
LLDLPDQQRILARNEARHQPMKNRLLLATTCYLLLSNLTLFGSEAANEATLYRDEFGIPHVYARTLEAATFAVGYAQAEDRLEELLKNYRRANGTMAEVFRAISGTT